jgi:hypothetical protein
MLSWILTLSRQPCVMLASALHVVDKVATIECELIHAERQHPQAMKLVGHRRRVYRLVVFDVRRGEIGILRWVGYFDETEALYNVLSVTDTVQARVTVAYLVQGRSSEYELVL